MSTLDMTDGTIRTILFGDDLDESNNQLHKVLQQRRTVETRVRCGPNAIGTVRDELVKTANGLLDMNVIDFAATAWRKYDAITSAARRTSTNRSEETVGVVPHRITIAQRPTIEVCLNGMSAGTIAVELTGALAMSAMTLVVNSGHLVEIRSGTCTADVALAVEGFDVTRRTRKLSVPGARRLRRPVALVRDGTPMPDRGQTVPTQRENVPARVQNVPAQRENAPDRQQETRMS